MAIHFNETDAFYRVADAAGLTLPDGPWCVGFIYKIADNTGTAFQYIISTNTGGLAANSFSVYMPEDSYTTTNLRGKVIYVARDAENDQFSGGDHQASIPANGGDDTWRVYIAQRTAGGNFQAWEAPILGSASMHFSQAPSGNPVNAIDGNILEIGRRADSDAARYYGGDIYRFFKGNFELSQSEIEQYAAGTAITTIKSTGVSVYLEMESADATLTDATGNGNDATRFGSPTTIASPSFSVGLKISVTLKRRDDTLFSSQSGIRVWVFSESAIGGITATLIGNSINASTDANGALELVVDDSGLSAGSVVTVVATTSDGTVSAQARGVVRPTALVST